jgi:hypothetical protein
VSTSISYTRQFSHKDWIDFVDSVQAGGTNGINGRMHAIEAEFDQLSKVIGLISASLVIPPPTTTLTFAPAFLPNLTNPPWLQNSGIATKGAGPTADGWIQVHLPDGVQLQTMTVIGAKSGTMTSFNIQLVRQPLTGGANTTLASIPAADQTDTFTLAGSVPANLNQVDNTNNKYLVFAKIIGADATATASLNAIQIVCKRS